MNNDATDRILQAIERTREQAKEAENDFDIAEQHIQMMAENSINLFGGNTVSRVADIVAESKKACDNLYAAYQSLIISVDRMCRPFIEENPEPSAIKKVGELIEWLNNESEIENNFTASLNGSSLGGVASGRYIPSIECKMLENYWKDTYLNIPGIREAEEIKKRETDEKRKKEQERFAKMAEENEEKKKSELENYKKQIEDWKNECLRIKELRVKKLEEMILSKSKIENEKIDEEHNLILGELEDKIKQVETQIEETTKEMHSLGFFELSEKYIKKKTIKSLNVEHEDLKQKVNAEEKSYTDKKEEMNLKIGQNKRDMEKQIEKQYPLPIEPKIPSGPCENEIIKEVIIEFMQTNKGYDGGLFDISEMMEQCEKLNGYIIPRIRTLMRQLENENKVVSVEVKRKIYFRLR